MRKKSPSKVLQARRAELNKQIDYVCDATQKVLDFAESFRSGNRETDWLLLVALREYFADWTAKCSDQQFISRAAEMFRKGLPRKHEAKRGAS